MRRDRVAEQLPEDGRVGHAEGFMNEFAREVQAGAAAELEPRRLVKFKRVDQNSVVVEDGEITVVAHGDAGFL